MIKGSSVRYTKRERIVDGSSEKAFSQDPGIGNRINSELKAMGFPVWVDDSQKNSFMMDNEGNIKYPDLVRGGASLVESVDPDKVKEKITEKYGATGPEEVEKNFNK